MDDLLFWVNCAEFFGIGMGVAVFAGIVSYLRCKRFKCHCGVLYYIGIDMRLKRIWWLLRCIASWGQLVQCVVHGWDTLTTPPHR